MTGRTGSLRLTAQQDGIGVDLTYTFRPDDYRIDVAGRVTGVGPERRAAAGRHGADARATPRPTSRRTTRDLALVTKRDETERTRLLRASRPGEPGR